MGAEESLLAAAFDPRVAMSIPACYSPDLNVTASYGPSCWMWNWLDISEYVDTSDFCALIAPRPLLIETGKQDTTYQLPTVNGFPPFASDKQVARRARVAYADAPDHFIHYLYTEDRPDPPFDAHSYHFGGTGAVELFVRTPVLIEPTGGDMFTWQTSGDTVSSQDTVFDKIRKLT